MLSVFTAACGQKEPVDVEDDTPEVVDEPDGDTVEEPTEPIGQITIGNTTALTADWSIMWNNNSADVDVKSFITGYDTVVTNMDGEYIINPTVVADHEITENEDGSKTYTWTINDGLTFDDGTPITAENYVAYYAFWASPVIAEAEGYNTAGYDLIGWSDYASGEADRFPGVKLIDEMTFSTTISAESLPDFFELTLVSSEPIKLDYWTDDTVELVHDDNGVGLSDNFTHDNFGDKIQEARFGLLPSTGPYVLESYDEASKTAVLQVNENFLGNYEGRKPLIQTIVYKVVTNETAIDEISTGGVDLLSSINNGDLINAGLDLVDKGGIEYTDYPRAGYGKLVFICDNGPTQFVEVRQALAHLLDRNDFAKSFTGGFGSVVNGPYGEAQWFYQETKAELNEKLNPYPYSLEEAVKLLEEGGWVYDKDGNDYPGEGLRYKKLEDGTLMPLKLKWASTEDNEVSDLLVIKLKENPDVKAAGMEIEQDVMAWGEFLNYLNRDATQDSKYGVPTYNMFNLATGFYPRYDMSKAYTTDPKLLKMGYNDNYILDEELEKAGIAMKNVDPEDPDMFKEKFVEFIVRWNEMLPDLPLYSNIYHDFYTDRLQNYERHDLIRVSDALLYSFVTE